MSVKKINPKTLLIMVALVLLGALPFAKVGGFEFVAFMDRVSLEDIFTSMDGRGRIVEVKHRFNYVNPRVQEGINGENAAWAFSTMQISDEALTGSFWRQRSWHPLTWLSLMVDSTFWNMDPGGFHLTNLFLHLFTTVLCYLVTMRLTRNRFVGFCTAAIFCVHPVQSIAVGWVSARQACLGGFFFFLTLLMYLRYGDIQRGQPGRRKYYLLAIVFAIFAVLSKTSNLVLPFIMLLTDWRFHRKGFDREEEFKLGKLVKHQVLDKWPFLAMSAAILLVASPFRILRRSYPSDGFDYGNFLTGVFSHLGRYFEQIFFPVKLLPVFFPMPEAKLGWIYFIAGLLGFIVLSGVAILSRRSRPQLFFAWIWFVICMLPAVGIGHPRSVFTIGYELYVPLFGLIFGVCSLAFRWAGKSGGRSWGVFGGMAVIIIACAIGSFVKVGNWKNNEAQIAAIKVYHSDASDFYAQMIAPWQQDIGFGEAQQYAMLIEQAKAFKTKGEEAKATEAYLKAWEENSDDPDVASELAQLYEKSDSVKAGKFYTIACDLTNNDDAEYLYDAALFFLNQRDPAKATEFFNLANGAASKTEGMQRKLEILEQEIMNVLQE